MEGHTLYIKDHISTASVARSSCSYTVLVFRKLQLPNLQNESIRVPSCSSWYVLSIRLSLIQGFS